MRRRLLEALGLAVVVTASAVALQLWPVAVAGQAPASRAPVGAAASGQTPRTPWGHPDLQGIWLDEFNTPLERPARYADREFLTDQERAALDAERSGQVGRDQRAERGSQRDVAGAYNAVFNSVKPTGRRTSLVVEPANGRIPALTAEVERRNRWDREFRLALIQNTETCKLKLPACNGWQYGPPSTRFAETLPFYNTDRMNRHNGPEDQSLGDRCMSGTTPDFNGFKRIAQGPDAIAIAIDTGQGQSYQRLVYLSGSHPPSQIKLRHGDSRGRFEGGTLVIETTNFSPKHPFREAAEGLTLVERFTRVDPDTLEYAVTVADPTVWTAPWTVKQELKRQNEEQNRIYYEPRCHEGNYGLPALLIGARSDEKSYKEGRGPDPRSLDTATGGG